MALMNSIRSRFLIPSAILIVGLAVGVYLVETRPKARPNPPAERVRPVTVVPAKSEDLRPELLVYGEIVSGREAELRSMVEGRLVYLDPSFRNGAYIAAGSRLAEIDPFEYEIVVRERRADLTEAQSKMRELKSELNIDGRLLTLLDKQIELHKRDRDRVSSLVRKSQVSEKAYDDAELTLNSARQLKLQRKQTMESLAAKIEQQRTVIERARANLDRAERDLADTTVVAPFSGFLQDIVVATGKRVAIGESIGRLIDAEGLETRFELPNADYARVVGTAPRSLGVDLHPLNGTQITVSWQLGETTHSYAGAIERVGAEIDSTTGGVILYARITGGPTEILRPGAFVEVSVPDVNYEDIIVLPATAVSPNQVIYVVEDTRLVEFEVNVIREYGDKILIRSKIRPDALIVTEQFPGIGPGISVSTLQIQ